MLEPPCLQEDQAQPTLVTLAQITKSLQDNNRLLTLLKSPDMHIIYVIYIYKTLRAGLGLDSCGRYVIPSLPGSKSLAPSQRLQQSLLLRFSDAQNVPS